MLPVRTMAPKPAAKQTSAAASKIKNKILNTSSFFKVSLKTNNKALALALEAQKQRSRQLEKEIVYLQKQVEALCFELATRKHKHRKLLLILKNLHSNTLQHLDMVADLFTDSDSPKLPEKDKNLPGDINNENVVMGSFTDHFLPQPDISRVSLCPLQKVTADLPENKNSANVCDIQNRPINSTDDKTDAEERNVSSPTQSPRTETSRSSSRLRDEVQRLSTVLSQSGFDMNSVLCLPSRQTPSVESTCEKPEPSLSHDAQLPSGSVKEAEPQHGNKQENTVLLNSTMEFTLSNASEIVTVETKAKKAKKLKGKKKKEQVSQSGGPEGPQMKDCADSRLTEAQSAPAGTGVHTDDHALEESGVPNLTKPLSLQTQCLRVATSRIPKLSKSEAGNHEKRTKEKFKSHDLTKSKMVSHDTVISDLDDYFMDPHPEIQFSKSRGSVVLPDKDTAEEAAFQITCRRPRTKGRRMSSVTRKTFFTLPFQLFESENSQSKLKNVCDKMHKERTEDGPEGERKTATNSEGRHKSRCRSTFVISVANDDISPNRASLEVDTREKDFRPSTGSSDCEEGGSNGSLQHSESITQRDSDGVFVEETQRSCVHPGLTPPDSGNPQHNLRNYDIHEVLSLDQCHTSGTELQKSKIVMKEESRQFSKRKAAQRDECVDNLNERKKKKKSSSRNRGFRSEEGACYLGDCIDDTEQNKEKLDDLQGVDLHSDVSDIFEHTYGSKSRMECDPEPRRRTSKLHPQIETRNPRKTSVVYMQKTQDNVSQNNTRTSDLSHANSHMMDICDETVHQNVGDLLMDEVPPWLAIDVTTADTEVDSFLATPKRETSRRAEATEKSAAVTNEASSGVLTSLTNTPDTENRGRTRRRVGVVSYREPTLNSKMRRGDKFTESTFLSSPVFKDGKKKRQKKNVTKLKLERPVSVD